MIGPILATVIALSAIGTLFVVGLVLSEILRMVGFPVHVFKKIHRSGYTKECKHCGEQRQAYMLWVTGPQISWWETIKDGDGSCWGKPLPRRYEWY